MQVQMTAGLMRFSCLEGIKAYLLKCQKLHKVPTFFQLTQTVMCFPIFKRSSSLYRTSEIMLYPERKAEVGRCMRELVYFFMYRFIVQKEEAGLVFIG